MYLATSTFHLQTLLPKYQVFTHHERIETMNLKMKVLFPRPIYFVDSKDTNTFRGIVIQREFLSLVATSRHPPCSPITAGSTQLFVPCFVGVASGWHRGHGDTWHNLQKLCKFFRKLGLFSIFLTSINVVCGSARAWQQQLLYNVQPIQILKLTMQWKFYLLTEAFLPLLPCDIFKFYASSRGKRCRGLLNRGNEKVGR